MADRKIDRQEIRTAFLGVRSDDLRRRIFETVSFNLAHEAIWHTKTATRDEALAAHNHRLAEFDQASKNQQAAQFTLLVKLLRQQEYIESALNMLQKWKNH